MGHGQQAMGNELWASAMGNGRWAMGDGQWAIGIGQWAMGIGNWQWATGNGQRGMGNGQLATGNGQWESTMGSERYLAGGLGLPPAAQQHQSAPCRTHLQ